MLSGYFTLALRNLAKYRLYATINVAGLTLGLTVFLFSTLVVSYEFSHDKMFANYERIFTVGSLFAETSGEPINEYPSARLAYGPLFDREIDHLELVARSLQRRRLLSVDGAHHYAGVRFVDGGFTRIFDFDYLQGDADALDDPRGLILTAKMARQLFGSGDVLGREVVLAHRYSMVVRAVIADVEADSHFNSSLLPYSKLTAIASLQALIAIGGFDEQKSWLGLSPSDLTYILLPPDRDRAWLQAQVDGVEQRHASEKERLYVGGLHVRPLAESNIQVWESLGFPVLETVQLLGLLVLVTACLNYTNLATAQSFGRTREVGLRKTFGAEPAQLLGQFLVESVTLAAIAMLMAIAAVELLIPVYNHRVGETLLLDYWVLLPGMLLITALVGISAGGYPAYLISRHRAIDGLHSTLLKGAGGGVVRGVMISVQFAISIFILSMVLVIYFQNQKILSLSQVFPKEEMVILGEVGEPSIQARHESLRQALTALPGVSNVSFSKGIPFHESGGLREVTRSAGQRQVHVEMYTASVDHEFMATYDIPLLAGRGLQASRPEDVYKPGDSSLSVVINPLAAEALGFATATDAIGHSYYQVPGELYSDAIEYRIVGIMPNQYYLGVHTEIRPLAFAIWPPTHRYASVRLNDIDRAGTLAAIDKAWQQLIPDYPVQRASLEFYFRLFFRIPKGINGILALFAGIALTLALIGLFGLAAFMAQRRTKEIGLRKIMGASNFQVVRLLIWQFSMPVWWSLLVAMPLAYLASNIYLDFFPERFEFVAPIIFLASAICIVLAWGIIACHAIVIARTSPIESLRHE